MTPELNDRWRPNPSAITWIAGAFGLAIVLGAAFVTGFLNWPFRGKSDAKKQAATTPGISRPMATSNSAPRAPKTRPEGNDAAGHLAVAKLWADIDAKKLAQITAKWSAFDLAPVLMRMKPAQVADLLAAMPPDRASAVSREILSQSSRT